MDSETGLAYNRFRYYDADRGNYISQDPIGLRGQNPTLYGYVKDTNSWIDWAGLSVNLGSIQKTINSILQSHLQQTQSIDPNATIGYRGSAASGISKAHDKNLAKPFDANHFDVDGFIQSDYLANNFDNRMRFGSDIPGISEIEKSIDKQLREALPNNADWIQEYNHYNELISTTGPLGNQTGCTHDQFGKVLTTTTTDGPFTQTEYANSRSSNLQITAHAKIAATKCLKQVQNKKQAHKSSWACF